MNEPQPPVKRQPLFSGIAGFCVLLGGLLLRSTMAGIDRGDDLAGYSGFSVAVSFLVALTLTGLITGQIALIRGEKPLAVPALALFLNGVIFIAAILVVPR